MIVDGKGKPRPLLANAILVFNFDPRWKILGYDLFTTRVMLLSPPPWEPIIAAANWEPVMWTDMDDVGACDWLQREERIFVKPPDVALAIELIAKRHHSYHPVRDYVMNLEHDDKPRIPTMMSKYFGVEPSEYSAAVGRHLMIGAIARVFDPGAKNDLMPILISTQGKLKSTAIKALFEPWFSDEIADLGSKDAAMQCGGIWCIEISELDAMSKAEVSRVKAFISRTEDRYRPPYGRRVGEFPRQCVFVGSTNDDSCLKDWSGSRRFNPVHIGKIDIESLYRDRDLIWAEAFVLYNAGVAWWFSDNKHDVVAAVQAEEEQDRAFLTDLWEQPVIDYLNSRLHQPPTAPAYRIEMQAILKSAFDIESAKHDQSAANRVARILQRLGWRRRRISYDTTIQTERTTTRKWVYQRNATEAEIDQDNKQAELDFEKVVDEAEVEARRQKAHDIQNAADQKDLNKAKGQ